MILYNVPVAEFLKEHLETPEYMQLKNISQEFENVRLVGEDTINGHHCKVIQGEYLFHDRNQDISEKSDIQHGLRKSICTDQSKLK